MKKFLVVLTLSTLLFALFPGPAAAGSSARHRWEGAGIVLGTIGLIGIISNLGTRTEVSLRYRDCYPLPEPYYPTRREVWVPGHWEWVQVWVPGRWETVWIPGGYNGYGRWQPGRWEKKKAVGRYIRKKQWIAGR